MSYGRQQPPVLLSDWREVASVRAAPYACVGADRTRAPVIVTDTTPVIPEVAAPRRRNRTMAWRWLVPAFLLVAVVALGIAVNEHGMHWLDHYAYHRQPRHSGRLRFLTDPAEVPVAALLLLAALIKLRHQPRLVALWIAAFGASLVIEVIGKALVERPFAATNTFLGTSIIQGSFPSGHTMRAIVVAGAVATAWPRLRWLAILWAAFTAVMVELSGMHSPSEVLGGILGGLAIVSAVWACGTRTAPTRANSP